MGIGGFVYFGCVNGYWQIGQTGTTHTTKTIALNTYSNFNIEIDATNNTYSAIIDNETVSGTTGNQTYNNSTIWLFRTNTGQDNTYFCYCKLKQLQIYRDDILVRNFVPAKRNSDNKPGMYDLVNNVFYVNQGSDDDFIMGPELYLNNSQIDIRQKNNTNFVEKYKFNANNELVWANPQLNLSGPVNYSVVGSPTIEDGIVSGFSSSNYLTLPTIDLSKPFELVFKIITPLTWGNDYGDILNCPESLGITIQKYGNNRALSYILVDTNGRTRTYYNGKTNMLENTIYYIKIKFTGSQVTIQRSTDNINYENEVNPINRNIGFFEKSYSLGRAYSTSTLQWNGSIDLKETYIKVNDKLWFYGKNYTSENYAPVPAGLNCKIKGPVNYTEVGTLTNNDGVYSGFNSSDYLTLPAFTPGDKPWEMIFQFTTGSSISSQGIITGLGTSNSVAPLYVDSSNKLAFYASSNGTSWNIASAVYILTLQANTTYRIKLEFTGSAYKAYSFENNQWVLKTGVTSSSLIYGTIPLVIGNNRGTGNAFTGSIDLNETYIKVNNQLWFGFQQVTPSIGYVNTQTQEFIPAPTDGIKYSQTRDIKVIPPEDNTITLLYGVASDFSKYSLFGLLAQVSSGTYDVYIDDVLYATTASNTQTDIDFSTLGSEYFPIGTCTTPEELVLHKIMIKPTTSGETITKFKGALTNGASGTQRVGVVWCHFELDNNIDCASLFNNTGLNQYVWYNLLAHTAKNDIVNVSSVLAAAYRSCQKIKYIPYMNNKTNYSLSQTFQNANSIKRLRVGKITNSSSIYFGFANNNNLEQVNIKEKPKNIAFANSSFGNNYKLKLLPANKSDNTVNKMNTITYLNNIYPTKIDFSSVPGLTILGTYGSSTYPMRGLRGLKVSNEAPFTGTSPQINVSYTGLDRDALVELFNSLPDVSEATDGITRAIDITAATGNNLTLSGNATIDNNEMLANVDSSSSCISPTLPTEFRTMEMLFKIKYPNASSGSYIPIVGFGGTSSYCRIGGNGSAGHNLIYSSSVTLIVIPLTDFDFVEAAKNGYYVKLNVIKESNNYRYKLSLSIDKIIWVSKEVVSEYNVCSGTVSLLRNVSGAANGKPQMFLSDTYIKVDNNYIVKGYLTDNDRLIATNKGWTITE